MDFKDFQNLAKPLDKKKKKNIRNFITDKDMFGHSIKLNFDQNGDVHKTFFGGFFSMIVKILMFYYITYLLKRVALLEDPELESTKNYLNAGALGEVPFDSTNMVLFHEVRKQMNYYFDYSNVRRYVDMYYYHTEYNSKGNGDFRVEVKRCNLTDFRDYSFYNQWGKFD